VFGYYPFIPDIEAYVYSTDAETPCFVDISLDACVSLYLWLFAFMYNIQ